MLPGLNSRLWSAPVASLLRAFQLSSIRAAVRFALAWLRWSAHNLLCCTVLCKKADLGSPGGWQPKEQPPSLMSFFWSSSFQLPMHEWLGTEAQGQPGL